MSSKDPRRKFLLAAGGLAAAAGLPAGVHAQKNDLRGTEKDMLGTLFFSAASARRLRWVKWSPEGDVMSASACSRAMAVNALV